GRPRGLSGGAASPVCPAGPPAPPPRPRPALRAAALLLAGGLLAAAAAAAEADVAGSLDARYFHRNWRRSDGLPGNSVYAIAQTADGYLWIGTENGLARFDGHRFTRYGDRQPQVFRSRLV